MLIQVLADWARSILLDLLGRRAERFVNKWLKKRRRRYNKESRKNDRAGSCEDNGEC
jgi:CelD/BcsL family acetyltransferase involved in cellulose biosynthesis